MDSPADAWLAESVFPFPANDGEPLAPIPHTISSGSSLLPAPALQLDPRALSIHRLLSDWLALSRVSLSTAETKRHADLGRALHARALAQVVSNTQEGRLLLAARILRYSHATTGERVTDSLLDRLLAAARRRATASSPRAPRDARVQRAILLFIEQTAAQVSQERRSLDSTESLNAEHETRREANKGELLEHPQMPEASGRRASEWKALDRAKGMEAAWLFDQKSPDLPPEDRLPPRWQRTCIRHWLAARSQQAIQLKELGLARIEKTAEFITKDSLEGAVADQYWLEQGLTHADLVASLKDKLSPWRSVWSGERWSFALSRSLPFQELASAPVYEIVQGAHFDVAGHSLYSTESYPGSWALILSQARWASAENVGEKVAAEGKVVLTLLQISPHVGLRAARRWLESCRLPERVPACRHSVTLRARSEPLQVAVIRSSAVTLIAGDRWSEAEAQLLRHVEQGDLEEWEADQILRTRKEPQAINQLPFGLRAIADSCRLGEPGYWAAPWVDETVDDWPLE
ncbi:MAG: hypothetical protein MK135_08100 [Polyangiaceae bacterium]|nr:hypothetical protein [Polyangiaceae bacterium]